MRCTKEMTCLEKEDHVYCKVAYCVEDKVHFLECLEDAYCNYRMSYGKAFVCTCPARKEIYNVYNI
ncbi:hypothetical protein ACFL5V_11185 [Fibrobacterota bacterium]